MSRSLVCLLALAGAMSVPAQAPAQPSTLNGDWLGFPATGVFLGLTVPAYEHLAIAGSQATQRGWAIPFLGPECASTPDDPPHCARPVQTGAALLRMSGDAVSVAAQGLQINPFGLTPFAEIWPDMALAGHVWRIAGDDRRMVLARDASIGGERLVMERVYYRAGPDTAGHLFDYLVAIRSSLGRAICAVDAVHAAPAHWDAFEDRIARLAPVTAELRRLNDIPRRDEAQDARYHTLRSGPDARGDGAADVSDIPGDARDAWLALHQELEGGATPAKGLVRLDILALDTPPDIARRATDCIAEHWF